MTRKSPVRHHVRHHQRKASSGKVAVHDYDRGHGSKEVKVSRPRLHHTEQHTTNAYLVHITYVELPAEQFTVTSSSYPEAIEEALSQRPHLTVPWHIRVDKQ